MIYLIAQNKSDVDDANTVITENMDLGDASDVTKKWCNSRQITLPTINNGTIIPAHPILLANPLKINWWEIIKPEDRFMDGVNLEEIEV